MVKFNYPTYQFQPLNAHNIPFQIGQSNMRLNSLPERLKPMDKANNYIVRALEVIQYIIRMIKSTANFVENNSPVLRELPKIYQLAKAFHEIKNSDKREDKTTTNDLSSQGTKPKLFI